MKNVKLYPIILILCVCAFGCSLNYSEDDIEESKFPDLSFENLTITKVEDNSVKAVVKAQRLEQYSRDNSSFAEDVEFTLYDDKNLVNIEGKCNLLSLQSDEEVYTMFDNIDITSYEQNMNIKTNGLKWNNKTEQLVAPKLSTVTISNDFEGEKPGYAKPNSKATNKMSLTGTGFTASGVSHEYSFATNMQGSIVTGESENTSDATTETQKNETQNIETQDENYEMLDEKAKAEAEEQMRQMNDLIQQIKEGKIE